MKKTIALVAICATALSPVFVTPAFAAIAVPTAELEALCAGTTIVNPDPNSTYRATLNSNVQTVTGPEYVKSVNTITDIPGGMLISTSAPTFTGNLGRHGGSPNIFGEFKTLSTFSGGTLIQDVTYAQDTTFTYGCIVTKTTKGGNQTTPPGLQVTGQTLAKTEITRIESVNISKPDVEVVSLSDAVVCNSPEKNPGKWRAQNGYTGECSTALFNTLPGMPIRSKSQPPLIPNVSATANPTSLQSSGPATVVDEWTVEEAI